MEKQIEDHIITEAAKGDINAFEEIYKTYSRFVFNISLRVTCNYGDAQEVTQEAFMKIYNKLSSFSFKSSFKTWLYRIAVNTAINFIKKESRQREKVSKLALELNSSDYKDLTSNAIEKEAAIESLSLSLAKVLDFGDFDQVERTIDSALVYENIAAIAVYDKNGTLVRSITEKNIIPEELDIAKHNLAIDGRIIGSFEIGFSDEYIDDLVWKTVLALIIVLVGFLFLVGLALYIFMNRSIIINENSVNGHDDTCIFSYLLFKND